MNDSTDMTLYSESTDMTQPMSKSDYRRELVRKYHNGANSLMDRMRKSGMDDTESLVMALLEELINESDNLLGSEMISMEDGELKDASIMSFKRAEVLEKALKAFQSKKQMESESGIDVNSPSMMIIFRYFMGKAKRSFEKVNTSDEEQDLFFQVLGEEMGNWKKELRDEFKKMKEENREVG